MRFESPEVLILLALPIALLVLSFTRKLPPYPARILRLQSLVGALLILALSNPVKDVLGRTGSASIVVDVSSSADPAKMQELYSKARAITNGLSDVSVIAFAKTASISSSTASFQDLKSDIATDRSNLEAGLSLAAQQSSNVILVSDGFQNMGNVLNSSEVLASKIFPIVPEGSARKEKEFLGVSSLDVPLISAAQKSVEIRSAVQNATSSPQRGQLVIYHDDKEMFSQNITLAPGEERLVVANSDPNTEGIKAIRSVFKPQASDFSETSKLAYLSTQKGEKVLVLSGAAEDARLLKQAFDGQSYELVSLVGEQDIPELKDFSAVVLNNIALQQLESGFSPKLAEYVKNGGGFVMIGGNRSFGLGGYVGSSIAELLPLEPLPPQVQQKRLTVGVELVIDKSSSMGSDSKLSYAKEAAREVVRNLKDEDFIGVIGFDRAPFEVIKMSQVGDVRANAEERIGRLFAAESTNLFPAMSQAKMRLDNIKAGRKHMIILTDGKIPDADATYLELVSEMRIAGITLSTVLVGTDYDFGFLQSMAERGGGAFYQSADAASLPRIFLQDLKVRSGDKTMKEEKEFPVSVGPSGVRSSTIQNYPDLLGFVETKAKDRAEIELTTESQGKTFPLLGSWTVDKGKVVAFASDASGRWSQLWASWVRFVPFWTEVLDSVRVSSDQSPLRFDLRQRLEGDSVRLDLNLFDDPKGASLEAKIIGPDGKPQTLSFIESAKGSYQAQLPVNASTGRYELNASVGKRPLTPVAFELAGNSFKEEQGLGFNTPLLSELAAISSGKINPETSDLTQPKAVVTSSTSYRWELLILALITYLTGILMRELRISIPKRIPVIGEFRIHHKGRRAER